jgi:general secretion pathway protein C
MVDPVDDNPRMLARLTAFVIWGLVAATAVFWGLRLLVRAQPAPAYALAVGDGTAIRGDLSRLLGAAPVAASPNAPTAPELSSRFKLIGVMAPKQAAAPNATLTGPGYALIAVDGKPPRAFAVGASLDSGLVLQAVSLRSASIGPAQGAAAVKLEIPALPAPATGSLPGTGQVSGVTPVATLPPPPPAPLTRPSVPARPSAPQGLPAAVPAVPRPPAGTTQ